MKKLLVVFALCFALLFTFAGCGAADTTQEEQTSYDNIPVNEECISTIVERGYLIVGCKTDVPGLSFYDEETDTWSGLEIELAYKTAAKIFNVDIDEAKATKLVKFVGVTVADREEKLSNGKIDVMMATYTITDERAKTFAFSDSYYTDYIGIMVRNSGSSSDTNSLGSADIDSIAKLDGKYIGVPRKATTRKAFLDYINTMNSVKINPIFTEYDTYESLFKALKSGEIDAMSVDISILNGYVDSKTKILDIRFGGQHYGAAVNPENRELLEYVNTAILQ